MDNKPDYQTPREVAKQGLQQTIIDSVAREIASACANALQTRFSERPYKLARTSTADMSGSKIQIQLSELDKGDNEYHITIRRIK